MCEISLSMLCFKTTFDFYVWLFCIIAIWSMCITVIITNRRRTKQINELIARIKARGEQP